MTTPIIQDAIARKFDQNPQFDYLWRVELPNVDIFNNSSGSEALRSYVAQFLSLQGQPDSFGSTDIQNLSHRVYEFNAPYPSFDTRKSTDRLTFRYAADHNDIGSITMAMDEMEDGLTYKYLHTWRGKMSNADGTRNPPAYYKKDIRFYRLSATKLDLMYYDYIGYFPTEIQPTQNTYESDDVLRYTVTLTGDGVVPHFIDTSSIRNQISVEENDILMQDYRQNGFSLSGFNEMAQQRILDRVLGMIR